VAAPCSGWAADAYQELGSLLASLVEQCELPGAAVTAFADGVCVAEYSDGFARPGLAWTAETIVDTASVTKALTATAALVLVSRRELDLDKPVSRYWPAFATGGKSAVLVRHLLTHEAGLIGIRSPRLPSDVLLNWTEMVSWLEREEPWWPPGTEHGYHAFTYGYLIGELVRRPITTDRSLTWSATRTIRPATPADDSRAMQLNNPADPGVGFRNSPQWRAAEIPAVNGHGSATGLARLAAMYAGHGSLDGRQVMTRQVAEDAMTVQASGPEWQGFEATWGLGLRIDQDRGLAGAVGGGGCQLWADPQRNLAIGYVQNSARPKSDTLKAGDELLTLFLNLSRDAT
jgi:CubicO group peptidase (beta-lactamase class C family)